MPSVQDDFTQHCLELLSPLGSVRAQRMFGGVGLYVDGFFVALIASECLYLKVDAHSRAQFEAAGCLPFVYDGQGKSITMSYFAAPQDAMDSPPAMWPWARLALEAALRAQAAKAALAPRKPRDTHSATPAPARKAVAKAPPKKAAAKKPGRGAA